MIVEVSDWFRAYGFADVRDDLLIGAYPLDVDDVKVLERLGIKRVLNLVEDDEYGPGQRSAVRRALTDAGIEETRLQLVDYGELPADDGRGGRPGGRRLAAMPASGPTFTAAPGGSVPPRSRRG